VSDDRLVIEWGVAERSLAGMPNRATNAWCSRSLLARWWR